MHLAYGKIFTEFKVMVFSRAYFKMVVKNLTPYHQPYAGPLQEA